MAETIHEVRLPEAFEQNALVSTEFLVVGPELDSGHERRNEKWDDFKMSYDIGYGFMTLVDDPLAFLHSAKEIREFFIARRATTFGFRFKDWLDFELPRQNIGTTDGSATTFQIFKRFDSGGHILDHKLRKIVTGTETIWVNDIAISEGGGAGQYTLDDNTGLVVLGSTLAAQSGTAVEALCEFDIPVRFDTLKLDITLAHLAGASIPSIVLKELFVT